jgi:N-acetyl-anhydromuramyl-L-alanine amidase AmpD
LESTVNSFLNPGRDVSAHLIVDQNGDVYEIVPCLEGTCMTAWHAGQSELIADGIRWASFNKFSIGIELVNWNGNAFEYTERQYQTLFEIIRRLQTLYPALRRWSRIVGHEDIAFRRGKVDPGAKFDWKRVFDECYEGSTWTERRTGCPEELCHAIENFARLASDVGVDRNRVWRSVSRLLECAMKMRYGDMA